MNAESPSTTTNKISRDAELIALAWFPFGTKTTLTFARPHIITDRARAALDELEKEKLIEPIPEAQLAPKAKGWRGTEALGLPLRRFPHPKECEDFMLTTD